MLKKGLLMSAKQKIHLFHLTKEELEKMDTYAVRDLLIDTLQRFDLHKGAYIEIAQLVNKELDYMKGT